MQHITIIFFVSAFCVAMGFFFPIVCVFSFLYFIYAFHIQFLGAFVKFRKAIICHVCPSVRMEQLGSKWTIFMKIDIRGCLVTMSRKFKFD